MVDGIDKLKAQKSWQVQETNPSKQDKRNKSDEEKQEDAKLVLSKVEASSFEESPDWNHWIAKESKGGGNLLTRDLKNISFKHVQASQEETKEGASRSIENLNIKKAQNILLKNKTELGLMIVTGLLLIILIYLIFKIFI